MIDLDLDNHWYNIDELGCGKCTEGWVYPTKDKRDGYMCKVCSKKYQRRTRTRELLAKTSFTKKDWEECSRANCRKYIENFDTLRKDLEKHHAEGHSLFIAGEKETGKTLLLKYIGRVYLEGGTLADITTVSNLLSELRYSNKDYNEKFRGFSTIPVLLLDEFPLQSQFWMDSVLYNVLNERYLHRRRTFITGNMMPSVELLEEESKKKEISQDFIRTASKIERYYKLIPL